METTSREPGTAVAADASDAPLRRMLREDPWSVRFFQMVRLLERLHPERRPVGLFVAPADEVARFSAHTSLTFPASEIQSYTESVGGPGNAGGPGSHGGPARLTVNFLGLSTMNGPLPPPYAELLLERVRAKDYALGEFFDLFNHRLISLFYRGWKQYRFFIAYELSQGAEDLVTRTVYDLVGLGTPYLRGRMEVADEAAIYYAGLLGQTRRTAQGLKQLLSDYFDVPIEVQQFTGAWNRLPPEDQTLLDEGTSLSECLGVGTVVGDEVWDRGGTVTVRIGPMPLVRYLEFLPGAKAHRELAAWLRFYARQEFDFVVRLVLERAEVPPVLLSSREGEMARLGFASWLKNKPFQRDPDEAVYRLH